MRLAVLSVGYPLAKVSEATAGGAEQILLTLDEALVRRGQRSLVLAPAGSRCHGLLIPVPVSFNILDDTAKLESRRMFRRELRAAIQRYRVDVVHMHGIDFADYLPDCDIPVVATLHLPLSWYDPEVLRARSTVTLVCVSKTQARTAPPGSTIESMVPNGVDLERFHPTGRKGRYALTMGRICPEKAFHTAIDACAMAGEVLIVAGSVFPYREHREYFEHTVRPRLGPTVNWVGQVGGGRKQKLIAGARCVLIPSVAPETSSLVAMEAMACGTPVIAMRSGALNEIVRHGRTGFLVNSAGEMAEAVARIDLIDPSECRREAERSFSKETMVSRYLSLYESAVSPVRISELQAA
jgi:glycosyltransferase involved in cell wall biosynthesis